MATGDDKNTPPKKPGNQFVRDFIRMQRGLKRTGAKLAESLPEGWRDPDIWAKAKEALDEEEALAETTKRPHEGSPLPTDQSSPAPPALVKTPEQDHLPASSTERQTVLDPPAPAESEQELPIPTATGDPPGESSRPMSLSWAEVWESPADEAPISADPKQQLSLEQRRCYDALDKEFPEHKLPTDISYKELENKTKFKRDVIRRTLRVFDPGFVDSRKRD